MGYVPNTAARALAANRTDAIALVVPEPETRFFTEPYFSDILSGIGAALAPTDLQLLLTFADGARERRRLAQYLAAHRVDGVLLVSVHADDPLPDLLSQLEIPAVISGRRSEDEPLASVDTDNYSGARAAVTHLLERGRTTIATISGRLDVYGAQRRLDGYRSALGDAEPPEDSLVAAATSPRRAAAGHAPPPGPASGTRRRLRLLRRDGRRCPPGAARGGRRIPEDVALVGFDDSAVARLMDPPLTSVRQPTAAMGRAMTEALLVEIAEGRPDSSRLRRPRQVVLDTELVVRAST
ncbi:LacI family DNA-binding transcriptional regulator [Actinomadura keratinilytica]